MYRKLLWNRSAERSYSLWHCRHSWTSGRGRCCWLESPLSSSLSSSSRCCSTTTSRVRSLQTAILCHTGTPSSLDRDWHEAGSHTGCRRRHRRLFSSFSTPLSSTFDADPELDDSNEDKNQEELDDEFGETLDPEQTKNELLARIQKDVPKQVTYIVQWLERQQGNYDNNDDHDNDNVDRPQRPGNVQTRYQNRRKRVIQAIMPIIAHNHTADWRRPSGSRTALRQQHSQRRETIENYSYGGGGGDGTGRFSESHQSQSQSYDIFGLGLMQRPDVGGPNDNNRSFSEDDHDAAFEANMPTDSDTFGLPRSEPRSSHHSSSDWPRNEDTYSSSFFTATPSPTQVTGFSGHHTVSSAAQPYNQTSWSDQQGLFGSLTRPDYSFSSVPTHGVNGAGSITKHSSFAKGNWDTDVVSDFDSTDDNVVAQGDDDEENHRGARKPGLDRKHIPDEAASSPNIWANHNRPTNAIPSRSQSHCPSSLQPPVTSHAINSTLALLQTLTPEQWRFYDKTLEEEHDANDEGRHDDVDKHNSASAVVNSEEEYVNILSQLQKEAAGGSQHRLVTNDFNHILAHLAISSYLSNSEISNLMLQIFDQMKEAGMEQCAPDAITYAILMLAHSRRFGAQRVVLDLAVDLVSQSPAEYSRIYRTTASRKSSSSSSSHLNKADFDSDRISKLWSPITLELAFQCFETAPKGKRENFQKAKYLFRLLSESSKSGTFRIPTQVYRPFIAMLLKNKEQDKIVDVLQLLLDQHKNYKTNHVVDNIFMFALKQQYFLPKSNRKDGLSASNIGRLLDMIRTAEAYQPSFDVLRQCIISICGRPQNRGACMHVVKDIFDCLLSSQEIHPFDHNLVAAGLSCAEHHSDSKLAAGIIARLALQSGYGKFGGTERSRYPDATQNSNPGSFEVDNNLSFANINRAMVLCVDQGDMSSVLQILEIALDFKNNLPVPTRQMVLRLSLRAFANAGEPGGAIKILNKMNDFDLNPSDEDFAAVLYSCRYESSIERAEEIMKALGEGDFNARPGVHCYNTLIYLCSQSNHYSDAMRWYERMQQLGLKVSPSSVACLVHASYNTIGVEGAEQLLLKLVEDNDIAAERDIGIMVLKLFLPRHNVNVQLGDDLDEIRVQLRECAEASQSQSTRDWLINITRNVRLADMEDKRKPTSFLDNEELEERRSKAWKVAIQTVLAHKDGGTKHPENQ
ncbi:hypothetical protein ACA910_015891 [Epithemia clementina (nom. ined.)]